MARVLVTGASGFLGSNLALKAVEQGHEVWGTYLSKPFTLAGVRAEKLDICLPAAINLLFEQIRPDHVFHLAAISQPDVCALDNAACRQINVQGSKMLAEACARSGAKLIFSSSDLVFDGSIKFAREEDPANPLGAYGRSKLDAETAILGISGSRALAMRAVLMYGWGRASGRSFAENWLRNFMVRKPVGAFSDQYRCPVWVGDLCEAFL
ncbi:MAG: sugar nucleotide-binding protein, partial [candidate division FCPU426 bacterium]